jgi:hypothetical protein
MENVQKPSNSDFLLLSEPFPHLRFNLFVISGTFASIALKYALIWFGSDALLIRLQ